MIIITFSLLLLSAVIVTGELQKSKQSPIVFPLNSVPLNFAPGPASFLKAINSINNAAGRLIELNKDEQSLNWMVSPVSLATILGELMLGARDDFNRVLGEILSPDKSGNGLLTGLDVHKELGSLLNLLQNDSIFNFLLYIRSALFLHPDIQLKLSYKYALADIYHVDVLKTNFSGAPDVSMEQINEWVQQVTFGRIHSILPRPVSPTTASLYVNTVYFKGAWKQVFDPLLTKLGIFQVNSTYQVPIHFITGEQEVKFVVNPLTKCTLIGIPYEGSEIYFYIMLPDKDAGGEHYKLDQFVSELKMDKINEMIEDSELENITISLPKMRLTHSMSLRNTLVRAIKQRNLKSFDKNSIRNSRQLKNESPEELGDFLSNSYSPNPLPLHIDSRTDKYQVTFNMGSASDDFRFKIDDVMHKVQLDVDESGSEAIAVSTTLVDYMGSQLIKVNRPFLFLIRHESTGANLFWGAIYNPEE